MDRLLEKLPRIVKRASEQVLVASVVALYVIAFALLTMPESISCATTLRELAWDQLSTPNPQTPAGDLTFRMIKIWTNHVVDVELPRFRNLLSASIGSWQIALVRTNGVSPG